MKHKLLVFLMLIVCKIDLGFTQSENDSLYQSLTIHNEEVVLEIDTNSVLQIKTISDKEYNGKFISTDQNSITMRKSRATSKSNIRIPFDQIKTLEIINSKEARSNKRRVLMPLGIMGVLFGTGALILARDMKSDGIPILPELFKLSGIIYLSGGGLFIIMGAASEKYQTVLVWDDKTKIVYK